MTDHRRPHGQISLPKPLTSFIGREGELRGGRHVLVVPAAHEAAVLSDPALRPFRADLDVVTGDGATGRSSWSGRTATWPRGAGRAAWRR